MSGKKVTVRKQKIKKNHIREKLIFFTILTLILLIVAAVARKLCPYDPMRRIFFWHRNRRVRNIFWEQTVMEEICFQEFWWEVQQVFMRRSCLFRSLRLQEL